MPTINFSKEESSFTQDLGSYTPDKYSYRPDIGDSVLIADAIFGEGVLGDLVSIQDTPNKVKEIVKEGDGYRDYFEDDEKDYLSNRYFSWGTDWDSAITDDSVECWVEFEKEVKINKQNIKKINADISSIEEDINNNLVSEIDFYSNRIQFKLIRLNKNNFKIKGKALCLFNGHSVETTLAVKNLKEEYQSSTDVENVAWSDDLVPKNLQDQLNLVVDKMCKQEKKDYHPGSGKTVRDIVHPSLYCYVDGVSKVNASPWSNFNVKNLKKDYEYGSVDFWGRQYEDSKYQWLPAEFVVNDEGKVAINSYINNLDKEKYPEAYECIANIFSSFMPAFEQVCSTLRNDFYGNDDAEDVRGVERNIPLRNRKLQVVTKIVEYRVNKEENFDGVWHVEGMSHENILATGLYIFKREENFDGADIDFRRFLYPYEGEDLIYSTPQNAHRQTDQMGGGDVKPLGRLQTPEGRAIVFPNSHIHKLSNMSSKDGKDAVRRILVFWLVNPDVPIVSTANVEPQQEVMTFKQAKEYQLELMKERKVHKEDYSQREVYLCEH